jgi:hypothetical protein
MTIMLPVVRSKKALRSSVHLFGMSMISFVIGFLISYDAATNGIDYPFDNTRATRHR